MGGIEPVSLCLEWVREGVLLVPPSPPRVPPDSQEPPEATWPSNTHGRGCVAAEKEETPFHATCQGLAPDAAGAAVPSRSCLPTLTPILPCLVP